MSKNFVSSLKDNKIFIAISDLLSPENLFGVFKNRGVALLFLVFVFCLTRIPFLGYDEINPDGVNWHYRSQQFVVGLKSGDFERTYQHYHPGVTLMWITGIPIELYKQATGQTVYNQYNFINFNIVAKVSVVAAQLGLTLLLLYYLYKTVGGKVAYISVLLLTIEPFFLGNSRLYHMDVLLALFMAIALLVSYQNLHDFTYKKGIISGLFLALSFLTKSIGIGALIFVLLFSTAYYADKKDLKTLLKYFFSVLASFTFFMFLLFPALWVKPFYYLTEVFSESERVGIRKGHEQIVMGESVNDGGIFFYPLVLLMKVTPFVVAGMLLWFVKMFSSVQAVTKKKFSSPYLYLGLFYLGYFLIMFFPSKKLDRYMLPMYPFFTLAVASALIWFYRRIKTARSKKIFTSVIITVVTVFYLLPLISHYPYYFTYSSPLFGSAEMANGIIAQKPFGIGVPALKEFIVDKYGPEPELGFIDTKPMKSIYSNSKVSDIRVNGVSEYDLMVLGVNEEIPDKVLESGVRFRKDASLYINGLEYWRIYVKESK